jgi:hypothetical protein
MNIPQLTEEAVAHMAVALKALPENRETPLEELIQPACRYLLACREAARIEEKKYQREQLEKRLSKRSFSEAEIARLVIGDRHKNRVVDRFRDFVSFLLSPDTKLVHPSFSLVMLEHSMEARRWRSDWVDELRKLYPKYQKIKRSISQPKKKNKRVLART